jgi:endonuclease/exonuclease/phosphatase family metal-dependent hydrolase
MITLLLACAPSPTDSADPAGDYTFTPMEGLTEAPDVNTERLCAEAADPDAAADPIFIDCATESGLLADGTAEATDALVILAYNIERGHSLDGILSWLTSHTPVPDVVLLTEADRGCSRTDDRHTTWEIAEALSMDFVYAVEFMEVSGEGEAITEVCEHGNAVLSRYPMGNVSAYRHTENVSWYTPPEERGASWSTRLGGRIAVAADIAVGDRYAHLTAVHLASGVGDQEVRAAQAAETVAHNAGASWPVIIGGDTNAGLYIIDLSGGLENDGVTQAWLSAGYTDAHESLPVEERATEPGYGFILDLIFGLGVTFTDPGICTGDPCPSLSDHYPVWATAILPNGNL